MTYEEAKILVVIPVRMSSQRLPGKPLAEIAGQTLIERVWRQAVRWSDSAQTKNGVRRIVVSTDSEEIAAVGRRFGAEVSMTSSECENGSARVAATAAQLAASGPWDVVVNLQGDMPFIRPEIIEQTIVFFIEKRWDCAMATVATPILDQTQFESHSDVKVVISDRSEALYFSRSPVPFSRDGERLQWKGRAVFGFKHFGFYAFKPEFLRVYSEQPPSSLELIEKLEQLRLLEKGHRIGACIVDPELTTSSVEVDTPQDLQRACEIARQTGQNVEIADS